MSRKTGKWKLILDEPEKFDPEIININKIRFHRIKYEGNLQFIEIDFDTERYWYEGLSRSERGDLEKIDIEMIKLLYL